MFYTNFKYQYTRFFNNLNECIKDAKNPKNTLQLTLVYSVRDAGHYPIKAIVNGRVYGNKHAQKLGFKNVVDFGKNKFAELNK